MSLLETPTEQIQESFNTTYEEQMTAHHDNEDWPTEPTPKARPKTPYPNKDIRSMFTPEQLDWIQEVHNYLLEQLTKTEIVKTTIFEMLQEEDVPSFPELVPQFIDTLLENAPDQYKEVYEHLYENFGGKHGLGILEERSDAFDKQYGKPQLLAAHHTQVTDQSNFFAQFTDNNETYTSMCPFTQFNKTFYTQVYEAYFDVLYEEP